MAEGTISRDDVERMRNALATLHDDVAAYIDSSGMYPASDSLAAREQSDSGNADRMMTPYSQGHLCLESAADHAFSLTRLLAEPVQVMAPWTCVRAALESAALSCWLLDDQIGWMERLGRSLAYRYEGLVQQTKLARLTQDEPLLETLNGRVETIEAIALELGFEKMTAGAGRRTGAAQQMPSATDCIRDQLGEELNFRVFSGMAHSHMWALIRLGFHAPNGAEPTILEKNLSLEACALLLMTAADTVAKPVWAKSRLFGHDLDRLRGVYEARYDDMGLQDTRRFWIRRQAS